MFEFVKLAVVLFLCGYVNAKACGKCDCIVSTTKPGGINDLLTVNCSDSGISSQATFPDVSSYTFSEIVLESSRNKHDFIKEFAKNPIVKLNLASNEIKRIDDEAFRTLTKLTELSLSGNKLRNANLSVETFKGLKNLRVLNLYDTALVRLKTTVFTEMTSLVNLNIGRNYLEGELEPVLLAKNSNLEVLNIAENNLNSLHPDMFLKMKSLKVLNASWNLFEDIEEMIFVVSNKIQILDLSHNQFTKLGAGVFKNLNDLVNLDLSYNRFVRFEDDMFLTTKLRVMNFGYNDLKDVDFLSALMFDNLNAVYLDGNRLTQVDFIAKFSTIQILSLSSNQLSTLPASSQQLLFTLIISNNSFSTIPNLINSQDMPQLTNLILDSNPMKDISFPPNSQPFEQLTYVSICNMPELTTIKSTAFESLRKTSVITKREIETDREGFDKFVDDSDSQMLTDNHENAYVDMSSENQYTTDEKESVEDVKEVVGDIDETQDGGKKSVDVKEVDEIQDGGKISDDAKEVEDEIAEDISKSLDTKDEVFVTLTKSIDNEEVVEEVKKAVQEVQPSVMSGEIRAVTRRVANEVQKKAVQECRKNSMYLKISGNKNLDTIEDGALLGLNLCKLDLSSNSLSAVPNTIVAWSDVPFIDLQYNPWDCTCEQQWMLEVIVPSLYQHNPELLYELRCGNPALLLNRRFVHYHEWTEKAFCVDQKERMIKDTSDDQAEVGVVLKMGESSDMIIIIGVCCGVVLLLVGVGIFLQWRITVRRRNRNRRL